MFIIHVHYAIELVAWHAKNAYDRRSIIIKEIAIESPSVIFAKLCGIMSN